MSMAELVAAMLRSGGVDGVYSVSVPLRVCKTPIVVMGCSYKREAETADGERGILGMKVLCVKHTPNAAFDAALQCRRALLAVDWDRWATAGDFRICGIDVGYPESKGRCKDGRWVVELRFDLDVIDDGE